MRLPHDKGLLRMGYPAALNWVLLAYAVVTVAAACAYAVSRIHADYADTLAAERNRLRGVAAVLQTGVAAMLNDGVGAAVASANELQSDGGLIRANRAEIIMTLQKQLTGGDYVRSLFLSDGERFAMAGRDGANGGPRPPDWLTTLRVPGSRFAWVGAPMADPERPNAWVIPVARRVSWGQNNSLWAGALFSFNALGELYRQFSNQVLTLALVSGEGVILERVPDSASARTVGTNIAAGELFRRAIAQGRTGLVEGYAPAVKKEMLFAYDLINDFPVYVVAGQTRDAVLASWRERRQLSIATTAAFCALIMIMTAVLNHYILTSRRREHHFRTLFNNAQFSVFLLEGDRFVDANQTAVKMFGLDSAQSPLGLSPWDLSPEFQPEGQRSAELAQEHIKTALRDSGTTFDWMHRRTNTGESFPAEVDLSTLSTGNTVLTLAVVHDVTARKQAEHALRELSAELMRLQDEERRRIGRDLHDSTGQILAALELGLAQAMHEPNTLTSERRDLLQHCLVLAEQCSTEIRTASYLLHPPLLDELGLLSALRWLADGFRQRASIEVRLDLPERMERLPPEEELSLFRIAQEALTNVHRHAASPWVAIRLKLQSNSVMLEIEDAGRGVPVACDFSANGSGAGLGVGLAGMRERIRHLGGTFSMESTGSGTRVRATIPIPATGTMMPS